MATDAQIEANQANALKSTGPRTMEGKMKSRRNALKHGLASEGVLPARAEKKLKERQAKWSAEMKLKSDMERWATAAERFYRTATIIKASDEDVRAA